jgi:hypothetical protein
VKSFLRLSCILASLFVAGHASAVSVATTRKACSALPIAVRVINALPTAYPKDWTIVVACSEMDWQYLQCKGDAHDTNHAFTNLKGKITVVRGDMFLNPEMGRPPRMVLLHELGHITCNCGDEGKAEGFANSLVR